MGRRRTPKFAKLIREGGHRRPADPALWKACKADVNAHHPREPLSRRIGRTIKDYEAKSGTWAEEVEP
jgi:hypothetical protein